MYLYIYISILFLSLSLYIYIYTHVYVCIYVDNTYIQIHDTPLPFTTRNTTKTCVRSKLFLSREQNNFRSRCP